MRPICRLPIFTKCISGLAGTGQDIIISSGRDGEIEPGRPRYWQGAYVYGQNENSLGICLIGCSQFSLAQMNSLSRLLHHLKCQYPKAEIVGHRDIQDTHKTCPTLDVRSWWQATCLLDGQTAYILPCSTGSYAALPQPGQTLSSLDTELLSGEAVILSGSTTETGFVELTSGQTDGYQVGQSGGSGQAGGELYRQCVCLSALQYPHL